MTDTDGYISTVKYLDGLFEFFNEKLFHSELPRPVITVQFDGRSNRSGWCTKSKVWKGDGGEAYEINLSARNLNKPIAETAADLLHETCHYFARLRDYKDLNANGRYHNKLFKRICEMHGLNAEEEGGKGYAKTSLTLDSGHLLKEYTDKNPPEFIYRIAEKKGLPVRINNVRKYFCPVCGSKVKATRSVNIICADCGVAFNEEIIEI